MPANSHSGIYMLALVLQSDFQRIYSKRLLWDYEADKYQNHMVMIVPYYNP